MTINLENFLAFCEDSNVPYVCWKGFHKVEEALRGSADLDVFVAPSFRQKFELVAKSYGLLELIPTVQFEGVSHWYLFNPGKRVWYHLHVYFELRTGPTYVKNFTLNGDDYFEDIVRGVDGIARLPIETAQAVHETRILLRRRGLLSRLFFFKERSKHYQEEKLLYATSDKPQRDRKIMYQKTHDDSFVLVLRNVMARLESKCFKRKKNMRNAQLLCVIGSDGAGKSSLVSELDRQFSRVVNTVQLNFGRPKFTISTSLLWLFRNACNVAKQTGMRYKTLAGGGRPMGGPKDTSFPVALYHLSLAFERLIVFQKAQKEVIKGRLVIMDRCATVDYGQMDGPKIIGESKLIQVIKMAEKKLYVSMQSDACILKLCVDVEQAILRNSARTKYGKETDNEIRRRHLLFQSFVPNGGKLSLIDANGSFEDVFSQTAKAAIKMVNYE